MNTDPMFTYWTRTMRLRVYWQGENYKIQQLWTSDKGEEKWEDLEHFIEPDPPKKKRRWYNSFH